MGWSNQKRGTVTAPTAKTKRIKHVFTDEREIAHLWMAHSADPAVQDNARNPHGNFYYRDDTIYSYGSHFPIATVVKNAAGERAVLFTTQGYSSTTSRHIGYVRGALDSALPVWRVTYVGATGARVIADYASQIKNVVKGLSPRAFRKTKLKAMDTIVGLVNDANAYGVWYGLAERLTVPASLEQVVGDLEAARVEAARLAAETAKKRAAKAKRESTIYRKAHGADLERWRATGETYWSEYPEVTGEGYHPQFHLDLRHWPGDLLRVDHEKGEVETSRGARVPLAHAERAYRLVKAVRAKGEPWQSNGHTISVGHYRIDRIEASGDIKAGCHQIVWAEIQRLAKDAGWDEGTRPVVEEVVHGEA